MDVVHYRRRRFATDSLRCLPAIRTSRATESIERQWWGSDCPRAKDAVTSDLPPLMAGGLPNQYVDTDPEGPRSGWTRSTDWSIRSASPERGS